MSELYTIIFGLAFIAILGLAAWLFLRILNRPFWEHRWVRLMVYLIPVFGGICLILWAGGVRSDSRLMTGIGATGFAMTAVIEMALLFSLPLSAVIHGAGWVVERLRKRLVGKVRKDPGRRMFFKAAAAAFPALAVTTGVSGVVSSFGSTRIRHFVFVFPGLPPSLEGLRILHLSDSHLGYYADLEDLEKVLADVEEHRPDVVFVTGDVADDLDLLPVALKMISQLNPPFWCYACLGNHEYYRGITKVREHYDKSQVQLLVDEGFAVAIEGTNLYVAGADDPRWLRRDNSRFLRDTVRKSLAKAPRDAFRILMSHRPEGFDHAADMGVELTLSGHTHGGQIGVGGRPFFEMVLPYKYLWGHYTKGNGSQLYTTSGMGHWFPFRLGCPPEVLLIELKRKTA